MDEVAKYNKERWEELAQAGVTYSRWSAPIPLSPGPLTGVGMARGAMLTHFVLPAVKPDCWQRRR
jgi:hypothetical protein